MRTKRFSSLKRPALLGVLPLKLFLDFLFNFCYNVGVQKGDGTMNKQIESSIQHLTSSCGLNLRKWETKDYPDLTVFRGATRICLSFKNLPFVAKACLLTEHKENEYEKDIYCAAKKQGLEKYFAKPIESFKVDGIEWTVFEKAYYPGRPDLIAQVLKHCDIVELPEWFWDTDYACYEFDECFDWACFAHNDADFEKLCYFLSEWGIQDLHSMNFGYKDGHIVFVDYAGG